MNPAAGCVVDVLMKKLTKKKQVQWRPWAAYVLAEKAYGVETRSALCWYIGIMLYMITPGIEEGIQPLWRSCLKNILTFWYLQNNILFALKNNALI